MQRSKRLLAIVGLVGLVALGSGYGAHSPQRVAASIGVSSFSATAVGDTVVIQWETATELNCEGFYLHRATSLGGARTQLNETLIQAKEAGSAAGNRYDYIDGPLAGPGIYYYWLEVVSVQGPSTLLGAVQAEVKPAAPTPTVRYVVCLPLVWR